MANVWGRLLVTLGKSLGAGLTEAQKMELQQKQQEKSLLAQADIQSKLATAQWLREMLGKAPEQPGYQFLSDEDRKNLQDILSSIVSGNFDGAKLNAGFDLVSRVYGSSQAFNLLSDAFKSGDPARIGAVLSGMPEDMRTRALQYLGQSPEAAKQYVDWFQNAARAEQLKTENLDALNKVYKGQLSSMAYSELDRLVQRGETDPKMYAAVLKAYGVDVDNDPNAQDMANRLAGTGSLYRQRVELQNRVSAAQAVGQETENEIRASLKEIIKDTAKLDAAAKKLALLKTEVGSTNPDVYKSVLMEYGGLDEKAAGDAASKLVAKIEATDQADLVELAKKTYGGRKTPVTVDELKQNPAYQNLPEDQLKSIVDTINAQVESNNLELTKRAYDVTVSQANAEQAKKVMSDLEKYGMSQQDFDSRIQMALGDIAKGADPEEVVATYFPKVPPDVRENILGILGGTKERADLAWQLKVDSDRLTELERYVNLAKEQTEAGAVENLAKRAEATLGKDAADYIRAVGKTRAMLNQIGVETAIIDQYRKLRPTDPKLYGQSLRGIYGELLARYKDPAKANRVVNAIRAAWLADATNEQLSRDEQQGRIKLNREQTKLTAAQAAYWAMRPDLEKDEAAREWFTARNSAELGWARLQLDRERFLFEQKQYEEAKQNAGKNPDLSKALDAVRKVREIATDEVIKIMQASGFGDCIAAVNSSGSSLIAVGAMLTGTSAECSAAAAKALNDPRVKKYWNQATELFDAIFGFSGAPGGGDGRDGGDTGTPKPTPHDILRPSEFRPTLQKVFGDKADPVTQNLASGYLTYMLATEVGGLPPEKWADNPMQITEGSGFKREAESRCARFAGDRYALGLCQASVMAEKRKSLGVDQNTIGPVAYALHFLPAGLRASSYGLDRNGNSLADRTITQLIENKERAAEYVRRNPAFKNNPRGSGANFTMRDVAVVSLDRFLNLTPAGQQIAQTHLGFEGIKDPDQRDAWRNLFMYAATYIVNPYSVDTNYAMRALDAAARQLKINLPSEAKEAAARNLLAFAQDLTLGKVGAMSTGITTKPGR